MRYPDSELRLTKAALAGDATAKRTIEAKELLAKADEVTLALRDKAIAGDAKAMAALRKMANIGIVPGGTTAPAGTSGVTQADVGLAVASAVSGERDRAAKVFASPASYGRERGCAALLTAKQGWSAAAICAQLPNLPTDAVIAAREGRSSAKADEMWDNANKAVQGTPASTARSKADQASDDVWAKAYGNAVEGHRA